MKILKTFLPIIKFIATSLAVLVLYVFSSGCSSNGGSGNSPSSNGGSGNSPKPCADSNLVKDWLPTQENHGTAFFRADCTFTIINSQKTAAINGTFKDLNPGKNKGKVLINFNGFEGVGYIYRYFINDDKTVLELVYEQVLYYQ
jgi:hypothetical protein